MPLTKDERNGVIKQYGKNEKDTGSASVQIALLTQRINQLTGHFQTNPKDHLSRRGLLKLVGKRRKLLDYLAGQDLEAYRSLIQKLAIRR